MEAVFQVGGATLAKLVGIALATTALLQPHVCYEWPPKAIRWFAIYVVLVGLSGLYLVLFPSDVPDFNSLLKDVLFTLLQSLGLLWISYNLMKEERVIKGALWAFASSAIVLAILQLLGVTSGTVAQGRVTSLERGPAGIAMVYSLGLLALFGLGYGRQKTDWKGRFLFWCTSGMIFMAIVQTGSRGVTLALIGSLSFIFLRGKSLAAKLKFLVIGLVGIVVLAIASYQIDAVRKRWERTIYDEDLSGRQKIYVAAVDMVLESPLIGWGPVNHYWELGPRVGKPYRDEHNLVLFLLAEGGILGSFPFFAGLWLCWRAAWNGRHGSQGVLPIVMLALVLIVSLNSPIQNRKFFWLVLAYALAGGSYIGRPRQLRVSPVSRSRSGAIPRTMERRKLPRRAGAVGFVPSRRFPRP
jgi:O-antigen ligase